MSKYPLNIREEELKLKVAADFFPNFDTTQIIGNIDFSVAAPTMKDQLDLFEVDFFLWAEAKAGNKHDIGNSLVQLIITIIKAQTFNACLPPIFLAAFDAEKIAFLPYDLQLQKQLLLDQHLENTIDWKSVTPSDHSANAFRKVKQQALPLLNNAITFDFKKDEKELRNFIKHNFVIANTGTNKINITLHRMTAIFNRWLEQVKPTIKINWADLAKENILPADFFLADALSKNNWSLGDSLKVLLRTDFYMMNLKVKVGETVMDTFTNVPFTDNQKAHIAFWNRYNRPPSKRERESMPYRRDLLMEPDRRERKGAFFTPHQWVELAQEYIEQTLGENWQEEYFIWDCCAGTGKLLYLLTEKERIFASTLDDADVRWMKEQDWLLPKHVFQFDFLNDDLQDPYKVPEDLRRILKSEELRQKLIIFINPPYAEVSTTIGKGKKGVNISTVHDKYADILGTAGRELYMQFFARIYAEIPSCTLAEFSKLKILQGSAFAKFRDFFKPELKRLFVVPAETFDNVKGQFPIGFFIWDTKNVQPFTKIEADVYNKKGESLGKKTISLNDNYISKFIGLYKDNGHNKIGFLCGTNGNDFQHNNIVYILNKKEQMANPRGVWITDGNIIECSMYNAVRHCIEATWLNDRDQFLYPNDGWKEDKEFQADCLAYTLFNNNIQSQYGTNHWIPFTEKQVGAQSLFESHFMSDFIAGKTQTQNTQTALFSNQATTATVWSDYFSTEAQAVMEAGQALFTYYHAQADAQPDASYYDIRRHFQGVDSKGRMNTDSEDEEYMRLWGNIKEAIKTLAAKIEPKVYAYGFLLGSNLQATDNHPKQLTIKIEE